MQLIAAYADGFNDDNDAEDADGEVIAAAAEDDNDADYGDKAGADDDKDAAADDVNNANDY